MKVIAVLGIVLVILQVTKADVLEDVAKAFADCGDKQKLNKNTVTALRNNDHLSEDNAELLRCVTTKVGTVDENGDVVEERLKEVLQHMWKQRLGDIPDVDAKVAHIVSEAIEKCKDTPKGNAAGQFIIKMRNCLRAEFRKAAPH